jgi:hypothetical protein
VLRRLFLALQRIVATLGKDPARFDAMSSAALMSRMQPRSPAGSTGAAQSALITSVETADAFVNFVRALASTNAVYIVPVFKSIVRNLVATTTTVALVPSSALLVDDRSAPATDAATALTAQAQSVLL